MKEATRNTLLSVWYFIWYCMTPAAVAIVLFKEPILNALWEHKWIMFLSFAAMFNAVMDSVENEHILSTVFKNLKVSFWSKLNSWDKAKKLFNYKFDAWHLSKSAMIICFAFSLCYYDTTLGFWQDFILAGCIWNHTFNGFYSHLFISKNG